MTTERDLLEAAVRPSAPIGPRVFRWFIAVAIIDAINTDGYLTAFKI